MGRETTGLVRAGKPCESDQQDLVMSQGVRHLVVEALVVLAFDPADTERNTLGDQQSRPGFAMVVGELTGRHRDGKAVAARQRREANLELHLSSALVADWVAEVAREFHEEAGGHCRSGRCVLDRKQQLAACAAAGRFHELGYPAHPVGRWPGHLMRERHW